MKSIFKKYYHSILRPDEFSKVSDFIVNKKNESLITEWIKPLWEKHLKEDDIVPRTNPELLGRIKEAILLDKQKHITRKINLYSWSIRVAAVLIVGLLISNVIFLNKSKETNLAQQIQTITTPYGAKTNYTLPDGSLIWLNSGSTFSYPSKFGDKRTVTLVGEAFLKVVKGSKPFIVSTNYGDVEVKGTSFNVKAYTDDNNFETTLVEGIVAFTAKNAKNEVTLKPGYQVSKTNDGYTITKVETKYFTSWKDGKLIFYREPFPSFIKKLERWYNVKIDYTDPALKELWYTGTIEMESISEVMEMISKAAPVSYSFNSKTRIFTIRSK